MCAAASWLLFPSMLSVRHTMLSICMFSLDCQTYSAIWSALAASFSKQTLMKSTMVV